MTGPLVPINPTTDRSRGTYQVRPKSLVTKEWGPAMIVSYGHRTLWDIGSSAASFVLAVPLDSGHARLQETLSTTRSCGHFARGDVPIEFARTQ